MPSLTARDFINKLEHEATFRSQIGIITPDMTLQDFQVKAAAAGFNFSLEEIWAAAEAQHSGTLTDSDLEQVTGGFLVFRFKLVAVKTIS